MLTPDLGSIGSGKTTPDSQGSLGVDREQRCSIFGAEAGDGVKEAKICLAHTATASWRYFSNSGTYSEFDSEMTEHERRESSQLRR